MKKLPAFAFALLCASGSTFSQAPLSDTARISLITLGPDQKEFYEAFGHSAIRVYDPAKGIDYAFNYGVFNFNQPNFYLNFTRGHLLYQLGVYPYPDFRDAYISNNRYIHEQVLNLAPEQTRRVFQYLMWNAQPENRTYYYDYFFNNCSTKIRDVFAEILKDSLHFDESFIQTHYTIRELERGYLDAQPWGDVGINIGLGSSIDRVAIPYEYMYLPDYLEQFFDHATIRVNGAMSPMVKEKINVYSALPEKEDVAFLSPWKVFGFILLLSILLSVYDWRRKKLSRWFDMIIFPVTGLLGLVLLLLWFATDHHACVRNMSLLWALPTNLIAVTLLVMKKSPTWLRFYFKGAALLQVIILVAWPVLPQPFTPYLIPLVAAIALRYGVNGWISGK